MAYFAVDDTVRERWPMNAGRYEVRIDVESNLGLESAWFTIDVRQNSSTPLRFDLGIDPVLEEERAKGRRQRVAELERC